MKAQLSKTFVFDAAHHLLHVPEGHKCAHTHGHRYRLTVTVEGEVDAKVGWVMDFDRIKQAVAPLLAQLDHHDLNDLPDLPNTTSECIAKWVWDTLKPELPELKSVAVAESETSNCLYEGR
jgi:6-pyruvoyltetrahydropterin/6-carboxytetrahydropterin synthase